MRSEPQQISPVTTNLASASPNRPSRLIIIGSLFVGLAIFVFDVSLPLGVAGGIPYVALVLIGLWSPWPPYILMLASIGTVLTVAGYALSPPGGEAWMVIANRALAIVAIWTTAILVAQRSRTEKASSDSATKFRNLIEGSIQGVWINRGLDQPVLFANQAFADMLGYGGPKTLHTLKTSDVFAPAEHARIQRYDEARLRRDFEHAPARYETQYLRKDGTLIWVENVVNIVEWEGAPAFQGTVIDISDRKRAEEQLRQSQKMDAVGRLTAGVAHDFNNLLAVIMSHAEVLRAKLGPEETSVSSLLRAASRGSELTTKLLAFSRQQELRPQPIDVHALISGISNMMSRTLGENNAIAVSTVGGLWPAYADPGQLENAILNLAINARDAMPNGGLITIRLENVQVDDALSVGGTELRPGAYVKIELADYGEGMTPDVMKQAFEPFYTTKSVGEGSGLGLSMVYGFAQQSGGNVSISSVKNQGTTVRLYLPKAERAALRIQEPMKEQVPKARGETILVLEDDAGVRLGISKLIVDLGYSVRQSCDGESALLELEADPEIDLLLSDVMLAGPMNGPETVDKARRTHADLKVVYMTGYADRVLRDCGPVTVDSPILTKPIKKVELANTLRNVLDKGKSVNESLKIAH